MSFMNKLKLLKTNYERSWFLTKWFFPRELGRLLEQVDVSNPSPVHSLIICNALLQPTWFWQRWFFPYLVDDSLVTLARTLSGARFLAPFAEHNQDVVFNAVKAHESPQQVIAMLSHANSMNILHEKSAQAIVDELLIHPLPLALIYKLVAADKEGLLTGDMAPCIVKELATHANYYILPNTELLIFVLGIMKRAGLLTGEHAKSNFELVVKHPARFHLFTTLSSYEDTLLKENAQASFMAIVENPRFVDPIEETDEPISSAEEDESNGPAAVTEEILAPAPLIPNSIFAPTPPPACNEALEDDDYLDEMVQPFFKCVVS